MTQDSIAPPAPPPPLEPDAPLADGLLVVSHLRRGRRLDVYDVWSEQRHSRCVAKTLRPDRVDDDDAARSLITEGTLLQDFADPHLVRCYEVVRNGSSLAPVAVFETLSGMTLDYLISRRRRLRIRDVAMLGIQLCSVLQYLHDAGWLHLDIKPANLIASQGRAVLIDLSLAQKAGTVGGGGTFDYLSPEQAQRNIVEEAADVWGLGATMYAALAGKPPYDESDYHSGTDQEPDYPQRHAPPLPLRSRRRLPYRLTELIDRCLSLNPDQRPTLPEIGAQLEVFAHIDPRRATA